MVIYWKLPVDGEGKIGRRCKLLEEELVRVPDPEGRPLIFVSPHLCVVCPYRGKECKEPIWLPEMTAKKADVKSELLERLMASKTGGKR